MDATFAQIEEAAKQANVHDFILGLPKVISEQTNKQFFFCFD